MVFGVSAPSAALQTSFSPFSAENGKKRKPPFVILLKDLPDPARPLCMPDAPGTSR